jgi:hypothetical protein
VLTLGGGWPRPFTDYSAGDPFAVRNFSEKLRLQMETGMERSGPIFPQKKRIKKEIRKLLERDVFLGFRLCVDSDRLQKRLVLNTATSTKSLPFMVWSAGQREFVPLLLGFYWLLPPTKTPRRANIEWVVIEELEMGLHPKAISVVLLLVLDLLARGYRVCLSTHSPHVLDVVWAMKVFKRCGANSGKLLDLFEIGASPNMRTFARQILEKEAKVYFFDRENGTTREISSLDPGAEDVAESGWGGLSEFSGRVASVVADVVNESAE